MDIDISTMQRIDVEQRLYAVIEEFVQDWGVDAPITAETRLVQDLGFDSIDVIQLVVAIESAFSNRKMGFQDLLMQDGRYVDDLSAGQIRDFVQKRLGGTP